MKYLSIIVFMCFCHLSNGQEYSNQLWRTKGVYDSLGNFIERAKIQSFLFRKNGNQIEKIEMQDKVNMKTGKVKIFVYRDTFNLIPKNNATFILDNKSELTFHTSDSLTIKYKNYYFAYVNTELPPSNINIESFKKQLTRHPWYERVSPTSLYKYIYHLNGKVENNSTNSSEPWETEYKVLTFNGYTILQGITSAPKVITKLKQDSIKFMKADYRQNIQSGYLVKEKPKRDSAKNGEIEMDEFTYKNIKGTYESSLNFLTSKNISLNVLPRIPLKEKFFTCDSSLYIKQTIGDTFTVWAYGWQIPLDTIKAQRWINDKDFGKTDYFNEINERGIITGVSLSPFSFRIEKDTLFEQCNFYKISEDSIDALVKLAFSAKDKAEYESLMNIVSKNTYKGFKVIHHPDIFNNGEYTNAKKDKIRLVDKWKCGSNSYFAIEIKELHGTYEKVYTMVFDNDYNWLHYCPCAPKAAKCLEERDFEFKHR